MVFPPFPRGVWAPSGDLLEIQEMNSVLWARYGSTDEDAQTAMGSGLCCALAKAGIIYVDDGEHHL